MTRIADIFIPDSSGFTFYLFNVNRRKSIINMLRVIQARFMKIYVLWVFNVNRRKSTIYMLRGIHARFMKTFYVF